MDNSDQYEFYEDTCIYGIKLKGYISL